MSILLPVWRSFQSLASSPEAASVSACCDYSLATLDVTCRDPGVANFAVTEQKHADSWRWATFNTDGSLLDTGCERTRARAHARAEQALESARTRAPFTFPVVISGTETLPSAVERTDPSPLV
jgi:hypothetical protein